jgi:hypothetical protein
LGKRRAEPLVDVRMFRDRRFAALSVTAVLVTALLAGWLFLTTLYLQDVRGESAVRAGGVVPAGLLSHQERKNSWWLAEFADAATFSRVLGDPRHAQQVDDALYARAGARARDLRPPPSSASRRDPHRLPLQLPGPATLPPSPA